MTLENKYKEIMNHVQVDEAMRARILENLRAEAAGDYNPRAEVTSIEADRAAREKGKRRAMMLRLVPAIAAAVAVLVAGVLIFSRTDDKKDALTEDADRSRGTYTYSHNGIADEVDAAAGIEELEIDSYLSEVTTIAERDDNIVPEETEAEEAEEPVSNETAGAVNGFTVITYKAGAESYTSIDSGLISDLLTFMADVRRLPSSDTGSADIEYLFVLSGEDNCDECVIGFMEGYIWIDGIFYEYPTALGYGEYLASMVRGSR